MRALQGPDADKVSTFLKQDKIEELQGKLSALQAQKSQLASKSHMLATALQVCEYSNLSYSSLNILGGIPWACTKSFWISSNPQRNHWSPCFTSCLKSATSVRWMSYNDIAPQHRIMMRGQDQEAVSWLLQLRKEELRKLRERQATAVDADEEDLAREFSGSVRLTVHEQQDVTLSPDQVPSHCSGNCSPDTHLTTCRCFASIRSIHKSSGRAKFAKDGMHI